MFNLSPIKVPDLSGRTVLVTGAGQGIGAVLSGMLASNGANVYAGVLKSPAETWSNHLNQVNILELDVTKPDQVNKCISQIQQESGSLDALINNAGVITPMDRIDKLATESLLHTYEVNTFGLHRVTCAALPLLRESNGVVVNAGTGAATAAMEGWSAYCSSKAAARMLTMMFDKELEAEGVQFFFLGIPPIDTDMQAEIRAAGFNPISKIPKEDLVDPKVPASVLAWLCGSEARKLETVLLDVRDDFFRAMMDV